MLHAHHALHRRLPAERARTDERRDRQREEEEKQEERRRGGGRRGGGGGGGIGGGAGGGKENEERANERTDGRGAAERASQIIRVLVKYGLYNAKISKMKKKRQNGARIHR